MSKKTAQKRAFNKLIFELVLLPKSHFDTLETGSYPSSGRTFEAFEIRKPKIKDGWKKLDDTSVIGKPIDPHA